MSVLSVTAVTTKVPVYNLAVDGEPEFYANGVLVHNCDALRYAVMYKDFGTRLKFRSFDAGRIVSRRTGF